MTRMADGNLVGDDGLGNCGVVADGNIVPDIGFGNIDILSNPASAANDRRGDSTVGANRCTTTNDAVSLHHISACQHHAVLEIYVTLVQVIGLTLDEIRVRTKRICPASDDILTHGIVGTKTANSTCVAGSRDMRMNGMAIELVVLEHTKQKAGTRRLVVKVVAPLAQYLESTDINA